MKKWTYFAILVLTAILVISVVGYEKQQIKEREYWISRAEDANREDTEQSEQTEAVEEADTSAISEPEQSSEDDIETSEEESAQEVVEVQDTEQLSETSEETSAEETVVEEEKEFLPIEVSQPATMQFLFVGLNQELYDEIYPLMKEYGYTGIIGISEAQYKFPDGTINRKQFYDMVDNGWKTCLICTDSSEFASWYPAFKRQLKERSIKDHNMVFFVNKDYSTDLNSCIKDNDIRIILHQGESDYPVITHEVPFRNWYIGSCRLQKDSLMEELTQLFAEGGNVTFSIILDDQFDRNYNLQDFEEMLAYLSQYVESGSLSVKDYKSVFRPDANW